MLNVNIDPQTLARSETPSWQAYCHEYSVVTTAAMTLFITTVIVQALPLNVGVYSKE